MARVLIVGCGGRGQQLASALRRDGFAVRGTSRDARRLEAIAATSAQSACADPDRIGTLMEALADVTVVCWLMGTATGSVEQVRALHDERLRMLLEKVVDTPVRGVIYEGAGPLAPALYARGRAVMRAASETWALPVAVVAEDPALRPEWLAAMRAAVAHVLAPAAG